VTVAEDWKAEARSLREQGLSERDIAQAVGKGRATVHDAVKDVAVAPADGYPAGEAAEEIPGQQTIDGGEVPANSNGNGGQPPVQEIVVRGTTPLDFFNAGGKLPNKASMRFVGGKVGLERGTAFKKGDVVYFAGYATVVSASPRDKRDKQTAIVTECELQIHAEIDDLRLTGPEA
jgi:hypothetical protein